MGFNSGFKELNIRVKINGFTFMTTLSLVHKKTITLGMKAPTCFDHHCFHTQNKTTQTKE